MEYKTLEKGKGMRNDLLFLFNKIDPAIFIAS
jgi:hypothetical protein